MSNKKRRANKRHKAPKYDVQVGPVQMREPVQLEEMRFVLGEEAPPQPQPSDIDKADPHNRESFFDMVQSKRRLYEQVDQNTKRYANNPNITIGEPEFFMDPRLEGATPSLIFAGNRGGQVFKSRNGEYLAQMPGYELSTVDRTFGESPEDWEQLRFFLDSKHKPPR